MMFIIQQLQDKNNKFNIARGRVIKIWNYTAGLGEKTTIYEYNSQNQITELIYQSGYSDSKKFKYDYDYAGRLLNTSINYIPQDSPEDFMVFNSYTYNQNSQINTFKFDPINLTHTYSYDSRNRITNYACSKPDIFSYSLSYYSNSNIQTQSLTGQYKNSFTNQDNLSTSYSYDKSNRLLNANFTNTSDNTFDLTNTFDPDGNILTMQRYGSNNNLTDNFTYDYYTGTNRLKKVSGSSDQYTYDYNGNQINDYLNNNTNIKYDHRNLITEFTRQDLTQDPPITDVTKYKYDEGGNRVRKTIYRSNDSEPAPLPEETEDLPTGWSIILDEYYSRDATGKEIAIYSSYTLQYWNVWSGGEIVGRVNNNENADRNYYLKDHLGSIRVVLDNNKSVVSANDYDMWGYFLQNRTYISTNTKNKFTGKERDNESSYDYFGARYYDARVGRWGTTDPLFEKHIQFTPYNYVLNNSLILIDPDGKQIYFSQNQDIRNEQLANLRMMVDPKSNENINYTTNSNGDYILDVLSLDNVPLSVKDPVLTILMSVANSNEPVDMEYRDYEQEFNENQKLTFKVIEELINEKGKPQQSSMGQTLYSGKRENIEKPNLISVTGRTTMYINRKYGNREAVKSLAHELYHVNRYILGIPFLENSDDFRYKVIGIESKTGKNYDGLRRAYRAN